MMTRFFQILAIVGVLAGVVAGLTSVAAMAAANRATVQRIGGASGK